MRALTHRGYSGSLVADVEDDVLHGRILGIRDVVLFEGATPAAAAAAFREAVDDYLIQCQEAGREPEKPYSGKLLVRMTPEQHRQLATEAEETGVSLNTLILQRAVQQHQVISAD